MPVPVFIEKILRRRLSERSKPLRTIRRHPNEITGGDGIPIFAQTIDSPTLEHKQAVFHNMQLYHGKRRARLERHCVPCKIEARGIRYQHAYLEGRVVLERLRYDGVFV